MSETIQISKDAVNRSKTAFEVMEKQLQNDKVQQQTMNSRRQAAYDMLYSEWAVNSIHVMASYTVMLVIALIISVILYFYGGQLKDMGSNMLSKVGLGSVNVSA